MWGNPATTDTKLWLHIYGEKVPTEDAMRKAIDRLNVSLLDYSDMGLQVILNRPYVSLNKL